MQIGPHLDSSQQMSLEKDESLQWFDYLNLSPESMRSTKPSQSKTETKSKHQLIFRFQPGLFEKAEQKFTIVDVR